MKINLTAKSYAAATEILKFLRGDEETTAARQNAVISISDNGVLQFYCADCGIDDSETVLIDRLESDSMGDGWESATAVDVIEWLETNAMTPEYRIANLQITSDAYLEGYNVHEYFEHIGDIRELRFASQEEAQKFAKANYKGPDEYGIGVSWEIEEA